MRKRAARPHGIVAEFVTPEALLTAAEKARAEGYTKIDAYTPFPIHGLSDAIGFEDERVPWVFFIAGLAGAFGGFGLQAYVSVVDYPLNVGGKPLLSTASFIPVTFECTILFAAVIGTIAMFAMNGLPKPYHPIFSATNFERASQDRFFLAIEAEDPRYDESQARAFLEGLSPESISTVEDEE